MASPGAACPGFAGPRRWAGSVQRIAISPGARHRLRGGGAARPSSGRPRTGRSMSACRRLAWPLGEGVSATEPGAPRSIVGRPTPAWGSGSRRRSGWRPPPDATSPDVRGRYGAPRVVATGSVRLLGGRPLEQPLPDLASRSTALPGRPGNVTDLPPQTPAFYGDASEVKLPGAPKSFRLRRSHPTTGPLPVGTFSSQDLRGVWPDLTFESYPVAPGVSSEGDERKE